MPRSVILPLVCALLAWTPLVAAQSNLGALLDAGARKISPEEFKQELMQRVIVGPSPTGASLEVIYTTSGQVVGTGTILVGTLQTLGGTRIAGTWTIDGTERVCTTLVFSPMTSGTQIPTFGLGTLPPRCQFWFKLGEQYFLSDSDSDRSIRVHIRTVKQ